MQNQLRGAFYFFSIFALITGSLVVFGTIAGREGALLGNCEIFYSDSCTGAGSFLRTFALWTINFPLLVYIFWPVGLSFNLVAIVLLGPVLIREYKNKEETKGIIIAILFIIFDSLASWLSITISNAVPNDTKYPVQLEELF